MGKPDELTITAWLSAMGAPGAFEDVAPGCRGAAIQRAGVTFGVQLYSGDPEVVRVYLPFGFLNPKAAAPLMRKLLGLNSTIVSCYFGMDERDDTLLLSAARSLEGLDQGELAALCDSVTAVYWQVCTPLVQEFQLRAE